MIQLKKIAHLAFNKQSLAYFVDGFRSKYGFNTYHLQRFELWMINPTLYYKVWRKLSTGRLVRFPFQI